MEQGRLQGGAVAPPVTDFLRLGRFERSPESDPGVAHGDHHNLPPEPPLPGVGLDRHPTTSPGMLHDILARLRQRHREPHHRLGLEFEFGGQNAGGALLDPAHEFVDILGRADRGDGHQRGPDRLAASPRNLARQLEILYRMVEEAGTGPVTPGFLRLGHREAGFRQLELGDRLAERQHRGQSVRRGPVGAAGIDQQALGRRPRP